MEEPGSPGLPESPLCDGASADGWDLNPETGRELQYVFRWPRAPWPLLTAHSWSFFSLHKGLTTKTKHLRGKVCAFFPTREKHFLATKKFWSRHPQGRSKRQVGEKNNSSFKMGRSIKASFCPRIRKFVKRFAHVVLHAIVCS